MDPALLSCNDGAVRNSEGKDTHVGAVVLLKREALVTMSIGSQSENDVRNRYRVDKRTARFLRVIGVGEEKAAGDARLRL